MNKKIIEEKADIELSAGEACPYCGQVQMTDGVCKCEQAQYERRILEQIKNACEAIEQIFGTRADETGNTKINRNVIDLLNQAAVLIANNEFLEVQINCGNGVKAKLQAAKGSIKVIRTDGKKTSTEV